MSDEITAALSAPFEPHIVQWRVGSTNKKKFDEGKADTRRGQALAYIDARDVMKRLDQVLGAHNWQDEYSPMPNGAVSCTLSIWFDDRGWVKKSDGAGATGDTNKESEREMATKGGFSDAFKRAAVKWGIGRYLYDLDSPWVALDAFWGIPDAEMGKLRKLLGGAPASPAPAPQALPKKDARDIYSRLEAGVRACRTVEEVEAYVEGHLVEFNALPNDWKPRLRDEIRNHKAVLRKSAEAAE